MASAEEKLSLGEEFIFSSLTAIASRILSNPLENAKLLKQLSAALSETESLPIYLSNPSRFTLIFMYQLVKNNGLSSLYFGFSFSILRYFSSQMTNYLFKSKIKQMLRPSLNDSSSKRITMMIMSGTVIGSLTSLFVYPLDVYRTIYAIDINNEYKTLHKLSWSQMYAGFGLSCFGIGLYRALYFGLYNAFRPVNRSYFGSFLFGYSVTVMSGILSYPIGTIQRSQMITGQSAFECANSLISKHGWLSLWNGAGMNIGRGMIAAATLSACDELKRVYLKRKKNEKLRQKKREILQYRWVRNKLLFALMQNREDWNVIIESIVCVYLDEYMQNEYIFAMELTDAFAVQKWKSQKIKQYLGNDMEFHQMN